MNNERCNRCGSPIRRNAAIGWVHEQPPGSFHLARPRGPIRGYGVTHDERRAVIDAARAVVTAADASYIGNYATYAVHVAPAVERLREVLR